MDRSELVAWLEAYGRAWETRDPEAAARLFSDDVRYYETPHAEPAMGPSGVRQYWLDATRNHTDVRFTSEAIVAQGDLAVARWRAELTRANTGVRSELDGIFLLRFAADGLCRELREWWFHRETPRNAGGAP